MKKFTAFSIALAISFCAYGCHEETNNSDPNACKASKCPMAENAKIMTCFENKCAVRACNDGFSVSEDKSQCIAGSGTCDATQCTLAPNAESMACEDNKCIVATCAKGFEPSLDKTQCITSENVCAQADDGQITCHGNSLAICKNKEVSTETPCGGSVPGCAIVDGVGTCVPCSDATQCTLKENATAMTCENNQCLVSGCNEGYVPSQSSLSCVVDPGNISPYPDDPNNCPHAKDACDGNTMVYCPTDASYNGEAKKYNCDESTQKYGVNYSCQVVNNVAGCYTDDSTCTKEGDEMSVCTPHADLGGYVRNYVCGKTASGQKFWQSTGGLYCDSDDHVHGYCTDASTCHAKEACKADSFTESCAGTIRVSCNSDGYATSEDCVDIYGKDYLCAEFDNNGKTAARCIKNSDTCTTLNDTKDACYYDYDADRSYFAVVESFICKKAADNKNYWFSSAKSECDNGLGYCSDTSTCHKNEPCDELEYTESCSNGMSIYCNGEKVRSESCADTNATCVMVDKVARCIKPEQSCAQEGATSTTCTTYLGYTYYTMDTVCTRGEDNNLYFIQNSDSLKTCTSVCDSDWKDCIPDENGKKYQEIISTEGDGE